MFLNTVDSCEIGPNYQLDDVFVSFLSLLNLQNFEKNQKEVITKLGHTLDLNLKNNLFFTFSGRLGLTLLLKSLNLSSDSEVLLQSFSCLVVVNSVLQANLKPIICDIDKDNYNLDILDAEKKITSKTKVIIIQYTMGYIPDIAKILEFSKKHNLIIIEDLAHSFGVKVVQNNQTFIIGKIGVAGSLSFGRDKVISSGVGGAVFFNQDLSQKNFQNQQLNNILWQKQIINWKENFEKLYQKLPKMKLKDVNSALFYTIFTRILIRSCYNLQIGKIILYLANKSNIFLPVYTPQEKQLNIKIDRNYQLSSKLLPLLNNQLKKYSKTLIHRQKVANIYTEELQKNGFKINTCYLSPIRYILDLTKIIPNETNIPFLYDLIIARCKKKSIILGKWYDDYFLPKTDLSELKINNNLVSQTLIQKTILNLPTNILITEKKAKKIINLIIKIIKNNI